MIAPWLLDEVHAVTPSWDGVHRAPRSHVINEPAPAVEEDLPEHIEAPPPTARTHRASPATQERAATIIAIVLKILPNMPCTTTFDITLAVRRRRVIEPSPTTDQVSRALYALERQGRARSTPTTRPTSRDERRVGGAVLWEAV